MEVANDGFAVAAFRVAGNGPESYAPLAYLVQLVALSGNIDPSSVRAPRKKRL